MSKHKIHRKSLKNRCSSIKLYRHVLDSPKIKSESVYDFVIVGGGISGLYAAYRLRSMFPEKTVRVLERCKNVGGRMGEIDFKGSMVKIGAGVGRVEKDGRLLGLLKELNISYTEHVSSSHYSKAIGPTCDVHDTFIKLRNEFIDTNFKHCHKTWREYALSVLGKEKYTQFITCAGFTDYENEGVIDTLFHYGFDDNYSQWKSAHIPWNTLLHTLVDKIGHNNIRVNCSIDSIDVLDSGIYNVCAHNSIYRCKTVIVATTVDTVRHLFPSRPIYKQICGQPFTRMYGKFSKSSIECLKKYVIGTTIVSGVLQKIIPINPEEGVYMIAYSDNRKAKVLHRYLENTTSNRTFLCRLIERALGIVPSGQLSLLSIQSFYWEIGTHYYKPMCNFNTTISNKTTTLRTWKKMRENFIENAQNPMKNVYVVGEMISLNQGWTEGALESVDKILPLLAS
jgi:hypothetical protein